MSLFTKKIILSLLPKGAIWNPAIGNDFDKFIEAYATNVDAVREILSKLSMIRDPLRTQFLDELEKEYGVLKNDSFTEAKRRSYLKAYITSGSGNGTVDDLQDIFTEAGFDVFVYQNDPAIDPDILISKQFKMVAGGFNAYAGRDDAFARLIGGELIVNGDQFIERPDYTVVANSQYAYAGNQNFVAGVFEDLVKIKIEYQVPTNPSDWPFVFFIGGQATFDIDGKITAIERAVVPLQQRNEFLNLIYRYKPLFTWAVSLVDFE